jgi:hypothetical protein
MNLLGRLSFVFFLLATAANAAAPGVVQNSQFVPPGVINGGAVATCDPYNPANCAGVSNNALLSTNASPYPASEANGTVFAAVPVSAASGNVANAAATATLAAQAGHTNYVTGVQITGAGATAASVVTATITGLVGGTASYTVAAPAGVTTGFVPIIITFNPPVPASAVNTAIAVSLPALGSGNTNAAVAIQGYYY